MSQNYKKQASHIMPKYFKQRPFHKRISKILVFQIGSFEYFLHSLNLFELEFKTLYCLNFIQASEVSPSRKEIISSKVSLP